ncbi:MAG: ATP-binding cassette domain-containing protein, partial [Erysipelotrichaceae bacterium]|nr:ATP-binding cassette domain-containing protein [Erysipelotrichaceae bacterium]
QFVGVTVRDDIAFGMENLNIPRAKMLENITFFANKIGLTPLLDKEPSSLSGGQKQRLVLSRAFAKEAKVLILDDASSALDYVTESLIFQNLKAKKPLSTILITQRVSLALAADKVMMLDAGKMVGYGTHSELMKTCDPYQQLVTIQLGGEAYE